MSDSCVGDIGTRIVVETGYSLALATVKKILLIKPDRTKVFHTADISGTTKLVISTTSQDLTVPGLYAVRAYVEFTDWKGYGDVDTFVVRTPWEVGYVTIRK